MRSCPDEQSLVQALLAAGASVKGKTHMDELAYSLNGENLHYGTPRNPRCPDRIPGAPPFLYFYKMNVCQHLYFRLPEEEKFTPIQTSQG